MNVFIVHGYQASPEKHWFPWLAKKVQDTGSSCEIVHLEDANQPQYAEWKQGLEIQISPLNEQSIVIAHSLGCLSVLDFLSQALNGRSLKAIFLIAPFNERIASLPELNLFIDQANIQDGMIRSHIQQRYLFLSNDDPFVPAPMSIRLGHLLNAQMVEVKGAKHFMAEDGVKEFPQLWERLQPLLSGDVVKNH
ncbi:RBBP9/YdeN family alpha/beta hydrolase [Acinetobacter sp. ANC 3832]|uniref:RBBP9/YdeN family alpha/beta hydrolase n=1 Tax=Acinetobacter sp. ANC 3832 TaxID=1977874 RepID=UPI000A3330C1|nr:alpha/beta hydrolase [Acinetobacter sp. ANC 3832]OTG94122.1 serine hydrolase [Acinetobacter sp. ANC 3832]